MLAVPTRFAFIIPSQKTCRHIPENLNINMEIRIGKKSRFERVEIYTAKPQRALSWGLIYTNNRYDCYMTVHIAIAAVSVAHVCLPKSFTVHNMAMEKIQYIKRNTSLSTAQMILYMVKQWDRLHTALVELWCFGIGGMRECRLYRKIVKSSAPFFGYGFRERNWSTVFKRVKVRSWETDWHSQWSPHSFDRKLRAAVRFTLRNTAYRARLEASLGFSCSHFTRTFQARSTGSTGLLGIMWRLRKAWPPPLPTPSSRCAASFSTWRKL